MTAKRKKWVSKRVDIDSLGLNDIIELFTKTAEELGLAPINARLDLEIIDEYYGSHSIIASIGGQRPMTKEELAKERAERLAQRRNTEEYDREVLHAIRVRNPQLFDEDGPCCDRN